MRQWVACGFDPESFWDQTSYTLRLIFEGKARQYEREHNERAWLAWHIAALTRTKRMPRLSSLLAKSSRKQTSREMREIAKSITRAFGGKVKGE